MCLEMVPRELFPQDICFRACFTATCFLEGKRTFKIDFLHFFPQPKCYSKDELRLECSYFVLFQNIILFYFYLMYLGWWIGK